MTINFEIAFRMPKRLGAHFSGVSWVVRQHIFGASPIRLGRSPWCFQCWAPSLGRARRRPTLRCSTRTWSCTSWSRCAPISIMSGSTVLPCNSSRHGCRSRSSLSLSLSLSPFSLGQIARPSDRHAHRPTCMVRRSEREREGERERERERELKRSFWPRAPDRSTQCEFFTSASVLVWSKRLSTGQLRNGFLGGCQPEVGGGGSYSGVGARDDVLVYTRRLSEALPQGSRSNSSSIISSSSSKSSSCRISSSSSAPVCCRGSDQSCNLTAWGARVA